MGIEGRLGHKPHDFRPGGRADPSECDVGADASCSGHSTSHRANLGWMSLGVPCRLWPSARIPQCVMDMVMVRHNSSDGPVDTHMLQEALVASGSTPHRSTLCPLLTWLHSSFLCR